MTKTAPEPRPAPPAWTPRPDLRVTLGDATPGEVRTAGNGTQWVYHADHGWQPYVIPSSTPGHHGPAAEAEAGG